MPSAPAFSLGIDLGGTHIKTVAITAAGKVLGGVTLPTEDTGEAAWLENVHRAVRQLEKTLGARPVGIGVAAPGLPAKRGDAIAYMPGRLPGLEGLVWQKSLRFPRFVPVLNDAHAALLGETWLGAARGAKDVLLLTLGTGVGGAAMVDGRLLQGHLGRAGHFGHVSLDPDGKLDIARSPGSLEDAIGDCTIKARSGGRFASTLDLVKACRRGDSRARRVWKASVQALAAAVSSLINVLDPQVVVLAGGIANAGPALFGPLEQFLDRFEWRPGGHQAQIVHARLGDRAGAFGAAWKALQKERPGVNSHFL